MTFILRRDDRVYNREELWTEGLVLVTIISNSNWSNQSESIALAL